MTGFEVVPKSVRDMAMAYQDAAVRWATLKAEIEKLVMKDDDLGVLAKEAGYPDTYNNTVQGVTDKVHQGFSTLEDTAETLSDVAKYYEEQDAAFYEGFGYIEEEID